MKIGVIFKKEFHDEYGTKDYFYGDKITIKQDLDNIIKTLIIKVETKHTERIERFPVKIIQLLYLGDWK